MRLARKILPTAAVAVLLTACAANTARVPAYRAYVAPAAVDMTRLLPPPPADEMEARDLQAVRAAQAARTPAQLAKTESSASVDVSRFGSVLGPRFIADRLPVTSRFLAHANRDIGPYIAATKDCWRRPRPFVVDATIEPPPRALASARTRGPQAGVVSLSPSSPCTTLQSDPRYSFSYPSGHATFGAMIAILLAEMVPEQRQALFAFGWEFGEARVVGGVHYPSDVEAGRILAATLVALMMQNKAFQADLREAKIEIRSALGYAN